jgi:EAL domain-containing protein (putative c-di-GMP-specific phosphodiesterase class I)/CheY-like chemotaxis protein
MRGREGKATGRFSTAQFGERMASANNILVVDDDGVVGMLVSAMARSMGLDCVVTKDAARCHTLVTHDTAVILLDLVMPGMDGIEVLRLLGEQKCKARIVLMSGMDKRVIETAKKLARTLGLAVVGTLQKPFGIEELQATLAEIAPTSAPAAAEEKPKLEYPDAELFRAFEQEEFVNYYQPQISLKTGQVTGLEVLSRWMHPERGIVLPEHFIARSEALGLIDKLCWVTVEMALNEVKAIRNAQGSYPKLSLNASVYTLRDLKFPDRFMELLVRHGFPVGRIVIEITETGLIRELARTLDVLTRLRMKAIQLSIDDFGAGYAMMQQLQNIPATELKVDMSLVQNMHASNSDRVMVEKTVEMGHELGMDVIAEGVTTMEQVKLLQKMGCDAAQGFLFAKPLPCSELVRWLSNEGRQPLS